MTTDIRLDNLSAAGVALWEPRLSGGDFAVEASDEQHIALLLFAEPGNFRQSPLVGVGLRGELLSSLGPMQKTALRARIREELTADGYRNVSIRDKGSLLLDIQADR